MCDQKRSGETAWFVPTHIAHVKLKRASQPCASGRKFFALQTGRTTLKIDIVTRLTSGFLNGLHNLCKFLLRHRLSSGSTCQILEDCSGGNSRPSRPSGVGGGTFLGRKRKRPTPKGFASRQLNSQRSISTAAKISWPAALALVVLILAGTAVFVFWRVETWPGRTIGQGTKDLERLGKDLRSAFIEIAHLQPRITVNNRTVVDEAAPTAELAILTKQLKVKREFLHTWAGSSKRIKLSGTFIAKAGFNLRQDVAVDVRPDQILIQLPHAEIVGVEEKSVDVLALENGLWNRVSGADLQNELAQLSEMARRQAFETDLPGEAEQELQRQLRKRIRARQPLKLVFTNALQIESPAVKQ